MRRHPSSPKDAPQPCSPARDIAHILFIIAAYLVFVFPILRVPGVFPTADNLAYHFPNYLYFANSLVHGFGLPQWYPGDGGLPIGMTSVNMFPLLPHRLIGYLFYALLSWDAVTLYKLQLVFGVLLASIGWWLFLARFTHSRLGATFGTSMVLLGGIGITIFHQEQIIATITWIPWILLTLSGLPRKPQGLYMGFILIGFAMTIHYPHIQFLILFFMGMALLSAHQGRAWIREIKTEKQTFFIVFLLCVLAAFPAIYLGSSLSQGFSSPLRGMQSMDAVSLGNYLDMSEQQAASVHFRDFRNYLLLEGSGPGDDGCAMYVTILGLVFAFLGVFMENRKALPVVLVLGLCAWAAAGINGYFAQFVSWLHFPFIHYFRQWYHFVPLIDLSLSVLGALGFTAVLSRIESYAQELRFVNISGRVLCPGFIGLVFLGLWMEGRAALFRYDNRYLIHADRPVAKFAEETFLMFLKKGWSADNLFQANAAPPPLLVYKEWFQLAAAYPQAVSRTPFFSETDAPDMMPSQRRFLPETDYRILPRSVVAQGNAAQEEFLIFPFAHKLGLRAVLNGREAALSPIWNGAMTGIRIPQGNFELELRVPMSFYQAGLAVQVVLFLLILAFASGKGYPGRLL